MKTLLLQLTDSHIREPGKLAYGRLNTAPYLQRAIASVLARPQQPDAVVITGDLTDFGREAEYAHLAQLLQPLSHLPIYLMPGNHDNRDQLRLSFPEHRYMGTSGKIHYSVPIDAAGGELQLIALDTLVAGSSHGEVDDGQLDWLEAELQKQDEQHRPVVIAMHHPPFDTLIGHMDKIGLRGGKERLEAIVSRHANVERIICGHVHRSIQRLFAGTVVCVAPSVAHQVCLDLDPEAASAWTLEPPGFVLHALDGERVVTHTAMVGEFEGPFPFHEENGQLID